MPRTYRMGRRADQAAETRDRIVRAAAVRFFEGGRAALTIPAVARDADVAPATVRKHFPTPDALMPEIVQAALDELQVPGPDIFDGIPTIEGRVTRLAHELGAFFDRGEGWWRASVGEGGGGAWGEAEAQFRGHLEGLMRAALGPEADELAVGVLSTVLGPDLYVALVTRGVTSDRRVATALELVLPWLDRRSPAG